MSDSLISGIDRLLRTLAGVEAANRAYPARAADSPLSEAERAHSVGLMRVNHAGEVCAQALYLGQSLAAQSPGLASSLRESADEEVDHLDWTARRLNELGGRVSLLDPLWLAGSLMLGVAAGLLSDKWSLAFLRETELQVVAHLEGHLAGLPDADGRSREVVAAMRDDESRHASTALRLGAPEMPEWGRALMKAASRVMTRIAYRI